MAEMSQSIELRPYQTRLVDAMASSLRKFTKVLGVAPTASGKSFIIAGIVKRYLARNPDHRVLVCCHTREILGQNEEKLRLLGVRDTGMYCAGVGRKETSNRVILASRDSLGGNPTVCGYFHMIIVDEAHLVSSDEDTYYQRIFDAIQPKFTLGLTGTPWRMDNGLVYGKGKYWECCADRITMEEVREAGFLSHYFLPPATPVLIDTTGVKETAGDFNNKQLTQVSMTDTVVSACVEAWWLQAQERRVSLFFCCSRDHAAVVVRHLAMKTQSIAYLDGQTSQGKREMMIQHAKAGAYKAIVNVGVLTTGTDIPVIDCVVFLRATKSLSLFIQAAGRGLRIHPEKDDGCMILDYAGNFDRFGSLENPRTPKGKGNGPNEEEAIAALLAAEGVDLLPGEAPTKACPACEERCAAAATRCPECGHVFFNHQAEPLTDEELRAGGIYRLFQITSVESVTRKQVPCVIVEYRTECGQDFKEWLFPSVPGFQKWQATQKLDALRRGATHVRVVQRKGQDYPKVSPLNLQSSGSFSLICLQKAYSVGDRTQPASMTLV